MLKISKFLLIALAVFSLAVLAAPTVMAEETGVNFGQPVSSETSAILEQSAVLTDEPQELQGVKANEPAYVPTNFGLWWRGLREKISLALTLDPVKRAEKNLKYAEERVKLADYIVQNASDPKTQEKARAVLEKATAYVQKVEERQDLLNSASEKVKILISDLSSHYANKEKVLEKLEDKLPPEKLGQFQEFRQQVEADQAKVLEALSNNLSVPSEVKQKIERVKNDLQSITQNREEIRLGQKELLEKIKAGDQTAKGELDKLRQEKAQTMEQAREIYKEKAEEIIGQIKAGTPQAVQKLKQLNQERQAEMKTLLKNLKIEQ